MYRFMNEEEIEISQLKNLKMIYLYKLGGNDAVAVHYGDSRQLNLCAMDANYPLLMEKVLTLYSRQKDDPELIIDPDTRRFLDRAVEKGNNHTSYFNRVGRRYMDMESSSTPRFSSDGVIRETLLPLLKYYLGQLYHMWNLEDTFEPEPKGWHRNCVLKTRKGKDTSVLPVRINFMTGNTCKILVGNFMAPLHSITFEVSYRENRILVLFESADFKLFGESILELGIAESRAQTTIQVEGNVVYHGDEPVKTYSSPEELLRQQPDLRRVLEDTALDLHTARVYILPWEGWCLCLAPRTTDGDFIRTDYDTLYLESYRRKTVLRQFTYSLLENTSDGLKLRTDGGVLRKLYYGPGPEDTETLFLPAGYYAGWDYKTCLESKYFYHKTEDTE